METLQIVARFQADKEENARVYSAYYKIVANHRRTLKVINLIHPICWYRPPEDQQVPSLLMDQTELEILREQLSQVKLQGVYINFDKIEGRHGYDLGMLCTHSIIHNHISFYSSVVVKQTVNRELELI